MERAPEPLDLSALDPRHDPRRWDDAVSRVGVRAVALYRLRRRLRRRGAAALVLAAAATTLLWWRVPRREVVRPPASPDLLDWATREVAAEDVLGLGGHDAQ